MKERRPHTLLPRGLSRTEAAEYIGVSASKFDEMVKDGRMPGPKAIDARRVWDRHQIDRHFDELPEPDEINPWDEIVEENRPPPKRDQLSPVKGGIAARYSGVSFNPETMNGDDYRRLMGEALKRWKASIPGTPLNVRERKTLDQLSAYGSEVQVKKQAIKDCGPDTLDRLVARGFVETQNQEKYPDRLGYLILTAAGMKACKAPE